VLHTQGLSVVTTLDARAQRAGLAQVTKHLTGQPKDLPVAPEGRPVGAAMSRCDRPR
jgi:hypothetical protein